MVFPQHFFFSKWTEELLVQSKSFNLNIFPTMPHGFYVDFRSLHVLSDIVNTSGLPRRNTPLVVVILTASLQIFRDSLLIKPPVVVALPASLQIFRYAILLW